MIQPLRSAHRRIFVMLGVVLPAILAVGLLARHPRERTEVLSEVPQTSPAISSDTLWRKNPIHTEFYRNSSSQEIDVVLKPVRDLNEPDLLLYWTTSEPGKALSADARLLGPFRAGRSFSLPHDAAVNGYLVLYSGAHQAVVDIALVEKLP